MKIISEEMERKMDEAPMGEAITKACMDILDLLLEKNIAYGNSALEYDSIFGNLTARDALYARINDKLARIKNNQSYQNEGMRDAIRDIIGYLTLLVVLDDNEID